MDGRGVDVAMLWAYLKRDKLRLESPMACSSSRGDYSLTAGYGRSTVQIHCAVHRSLDALWAQQAG